MQSTYLLDECTFHVINIRMVINLLGTYMLLLIERTRTHGKVTPAGMEDTYVPKQMKLCMYTQEMKPKVTR